MASPRVLPLVFTDLDGTLLDHKSYSFAAAGDAITALAEQCIPLIFNTSKTRAESIALSKTIGLNHPVIVENGGGIVFPKNYDFGHPFRPADWDSGSRVIALGADITEIKRVLKMADAKLHLEGAYRGFSDMTIEHVQANTGLTYDEAAKAKQREFSEPLEWRATNEMRQALENYLHEYGLRLIAGGRFHHVIGEVDKCTAMVRVAHMYENSADDQGQALTIALGDSKNDEQMLAGADIAVVVKNPAGSGLTIAHPDVIYTTKEGPEGWQEAIEQILPRL